MKKSLKTIAQTLLVSSLILGSLSTLPVLAQTAVTTDAEASEEVSAEDKEEE